MKSEEITRGWGPPALGGAALLLLGALVLPALPAAAGDIQTRGGGARVQMSPGTSARSTAAVASSRSAGGARGGSHVGGHHGHRGHGGHHGYRGHHRYRYGYRYGHSRYYRPYLYFGYGHYPYSYGRYGYGYGYGPYRYGYRYGYSYDGDRWGSLDLNVRPKKAQVYVNGQLVGNAGKYDGFPEYLWLKEGTYNLVFYLEGYQTLTRKVTVLPGIDLDIKERLEPGDALSPEALAEEWMEEPPEALAERTERQERSDSEERWRDRAQRYLSEREGEPDQEADRHRDALPERRPDVLDARGEPGRLTLNLEPADASVYLDGRFLGTAEELSRLHSGLLVDPGEHLLEVVHPSFRTERRTVEVDAGEDLEIGFRLAAN